MTFSLILICPPSYRSQKGNKRFLALQHFAIETPFWSRKTEIILRRIIFMVLLFEFCRWLKHNSLSYPQIGKLICMSSGNLSSIRHLAEWLKSIHVKGRFIGVVLMRTGGNILDRSLEELDEIVGYLESKGVRRDWMGYVVSRCPEILSFNMEALKSRAEFYLNMGMDEKDFGTMLFDCPKVLGYLSMEEMNQKVHL